MYLPNKVYITLILHFIDLEILWGNIMGSTPSGKQILIANIVKTSKKSSPRKVLKYGYFEALC